MWSGLLAAALIAGAAMSAAAQDRPPTAERTPNLVLVLGTPHLSGWPEDVPLENLAPLLDRLAAWAPQIIAIESIPGDQCWLMRHQPEFADTAERFCPSTDAARTATGLDVPDAIAERDRLLAELGEAPAPAARRRLAAVMLAAGDPASALVQWLRLPEGERHAGDGLAPALAELLAARERRRNEDEAIAARLAARLGLERLVQMDDQAVSMQIDDEAAFGRAMRAAWDGARGASDPAYEEARGPGLYSPEGVLAAYRHYNAPGHPTAVYARDFGAALAEPSAGQYGRMYVTYWETRNLRMAANIREALGPRPGSRMLVIVGASHKGYLDSYLGMMRDVAIVDAAELLD